MAKRVQAADAPPAHKPASRARFCELCGCDVPLSGWDTHAQGIRHRRRALGQREAGDPEALVFSIFEPLPPAHITAAAAAAAAAGVAAGGGVSMAPPPAMHPHGRQGGYRSRDPLHTTATNGNQGQSTGAGGSSAKQGHSAGARGGSDKQACAAGGAKSSGDQGHSTEVVRNCGNRGHSTGVAGTSTSASYSYSNNGVATDSKGGGGGSRVARCDKAPFQCQLPSEGRRASVPGWPAGEAPPEGHEGGLERLVPSEQGVGEGAGGGAVGRAATAERGTGRGGNDCRGSGHGELRGSGLDGDKISRLGSPCKVNGMGRGDRGGTTGVCEVEVDRDMHRDKRRDIAGARDRGREGGRGRGSEQGTGREGGRGCEEAGSTERIVVGDMSERGMGSLSLTPQASPLVPVWSQASVSEQQEARRAAARQLPHHIGASMPGYSAAAAWFSSQALAQGAAQLQRKLGEQWKAVRRLCLSPAEMACMGAVACRDVRLRHLQLEVPIKPPGPAAAALTCGLAVLLPRLRCHPTLSHFSLVVSRGEYLEIAVQAGAGWSGLGGLGSPVLRRSWGEVVGALIELIQARPALRRVDLHTPPDLLPVESVAALSSAAATAGVRCAALRLALLMGCHTSVGAGSPLRHLPEPLLREVVEAALPSGACQLEWHLQHWVPGDSSGSSSSSSDSSSSGDSGDSDSESETSSSSSSSGSGGSEGGGVWGAGAGQGSQGRGGHQGRGGWRGARGGRGPSRGRGRGGGRGGGGGGGRGRGAGGAGAAGDGLPADVQAVMKWV